MVERYRADRKFDRLTEAVMASIFGLSNVLRVNLNRTWKARLRRCEYRWLTRSRFYTVKSVAGACLDRRDLRSLNRRPCEWSETNVDSWTRCAVLVTNDPDARLDPILDDLKTAYAHFDGTFHTIEGTSHRPVAMHQENAASRTVYDHIDDATTHPPTYQRPWTLLPLTSNQSRGIVIDSQEVGHLLAVDGSRLTTDARRALGVVEQERTAVPRPPASTLTQFQQCGLSIGRSVDHDKTPQRPLAIEC